MLNHDSQHFQSVQYSKSQISQQHQYNLQLQYREQQEQSIFKYHLLKKRKREYKKKQNQQQQKQLTNIFYQLICLVNMHSKVAEDHAMIGQNFNNGVRQDFGEDRVLSKKRIIKPYKFYQQVQKPSRQVIQHKPQQNREFNQKANQLLKKSLNSSQFTFPKDINTNQVAHPKNSIFTNYGTIMNYKFTRYQNQPKFQQTLPPKLNNLQINLSEQSLVNSSKNRYINQRQFSIQKCVQIIIPKQKRLMGFYTLPQIDIFPYNNNKLEIEDKRTTFNKMQQNSIQH